MSLFVIIELKRKESSDSESNSSSQKLPFIHFPILTHTASISTSIMYCSNPWRNASNAAHTNSKYYIVHLAFAPNEMWEPWNVLLILRFSHAWKKSHGLYMRIWRHITINCYPKCCNIWSFFITIIILYYFLTWWWVDIFTIFIYFSGRPG